MLLAEAKRSLGKIRDLNICSEPIIRGSRKFESCNIHQKFYEFCVEIDGKLFYGTSISKRMAKTFALYEAYEGLRFSKCKSDVITKLVQLCSDHNFCAPVFTEKYEDLIYCFKVEVHLIISEVNTGLEGKGFSDNAKMAKKAAAKDVLDQLNVILEYLQPIKQDKNLDSISLD